MNRTRFLKLGIATAMLIMALTMASESQEVSAKSVTKKTVTITKGQKKKIKIKVSKVKKIKVKSSKKSVVAVKAIGKKTIRIIGKKAGKAVITVKVTTKKKKVKSFKYKVTVKKKRTKKNISEESNVTEQKPSDNTETIQAVPKYNYELKVMNTKNLYNNSNVVIYVKTNNPSTSTIKADCGTSKLVKMEDESGVFFTKVDEFMEVISPKAYDDVNYTDTNNAVDGGYLFIYKWDTPGKKNFTVQEKVGEEWVVAAKMEIELNDRDKAEDEWLQSVIEEVTDSTMTDREKMNKLEQHILDNFKYDRNNEQGLISLLADVGVYWERKHIDCWDATNMMCLFADKLGLESKWTYAGYSQHYYATVTIDGQEYIYDASPMSETGWIDEWEYIL